MRHGWMLVGLVGCGFGEAANPAGDGGREVPVLISGDGYAPSRIEASSGEALVLAFQRLDEQNCGGEIVFPSTGRSVPVPVGETVRVPVTAPAQGSLAFTCGMAMYEGALVVSGG